MATSVSKQAARRKARVKALQGLYQWDLNQAAGNQSEGGQIAEQFKTQQDMAGVDDQYFLELLNETIKNRADLDSRLESSLDRCIDDLDPIERSVCRLGGYELVYRQDVPVRVIINEWVEIAKRFGSDHGYKYINGVMDKLAMSERATEVRRVNLVKTGENNNKKV